MCRYVYRAHYTVMVSSKGVIGDIYVSGLPVQGFRVMGLGLGV